MINQSPYMQEAIKLAQQAFDKDEVPVGAVIVDTEKQSIIASAYNLVECNNNPIHHAELLAIQAACKILQIPRLVQCDLYVTLEPCPMCAQAISFARIRRLYYGASDPKGGGVEHGSRIFNSTSCHHKPEVYSGMHEKECSDLLKKFFQSKR